MPQSSQVVMGGMIMLQKLMDNPNRKSVMDEQNGNLDILIRLQESLFPSTQEIGGRTQIVEYQDFFIK